MHEIPAILKSTDLGHDYYNDMKSTQIMETKGSKREKKIIIDKVFIIVCFDGIVSRK